MCFSSFEYKELFWHFWVYFDINLNILSGTKYSNVSKQKIQDSKNWVFDELNEIKAKKNFVEKFVDSAIVKICDELDLRQTLRPVESTVEQSSNAPVIHFLVQLQR